MNGCPLKAGMTVESKNDSVGSSGGGNGSQMARLMVVKWRSQMAVKWWAQWRSNGEVNGGQVAEPNGGQVVGSVAVKWRG